PPQGHAIATQFAGVVAGIEVNVRVLVHEVINPVRNQLALARRAKVVIEGFDGFGCEGCASPMKIAQQFRLLSRDRQSSEQFAGLTRRYDEMQAECTLVPFAIADTSQEEAL